MKKVSIVIPVYNEEAIVSELIGRLQKATSALPYQFEFILVDDGSTDSTLCNLLQIQRSDSRLIILKLSRNWGHQNAYNAGLDHVTGNAVILMDGDLEDPPEMISVFLQKWEEGFDVVYALKETRQESIFKKFLFSIFYSILQTISDISVEKQAGMFSLMDEKVIRELIQLKERNKYYVGLRYMLGFKQVSVSYNREKRFAGKPRQSFRKLMNYAFNAFFSFSFLPIRLLTYSGMFILATIVIMSIILVTMKLFKSYIPFYHDLPGWTSVILAFLFLLGIQITFMGILGEYIARIFDEVRNRPYYIVEKVLRNPGQIDKTINES
ncbi:MAG: glycosyltransferase family 2 protein [Deltaproteobacteria bacterium]|nr:glycosyltransferase family 2 protein [Deltaproteobacteria bacterium]